MLYKTPDLLEEEHKVIRLIEKARHDFRHQLRQPRRWTGLLARNTRARAIRASNSIEGIHVSQEDAVAAVQGEDPAEADRPTWRAVLGYRQAMDYILQRVRDGNFQFSTDVILAVQFMITEGDLESNPGNLRPGWVCVRNTTTGEIVHEGADRDILESLMDEYVDSLNDEGNEIHIIKAAMAHLNLTLMHPFSDGNGRVARGFQTAILAREGIIAPEFASIEEYIGRNYSEYYNVLAEVGGGSWNPLRDARPWIRFTLTAHYRQAQTLIRRNKELQRIADELWSLHVELHSLPNRYGFAMLEAALGYRVRNASYRSVADISSNLASRDLKNMVDLGYLEKRGEKRGAVYVGSPILLRIREKYATPKEIADPFTLQDEDLQPTLL